MKTTYERPIKCEHTDCAKSQRCMLKFLEKTCQFYIKNKGEEANENDKN